jgi:DNA-binding NtrC family response regulator
MAQHFLLVDDDDLLRRSLAFNLEQAGHRVRSAANAKEVMPESKSGITSFI